MKIPKKKDVQDTNEELYAMRKKFHQVHFSYIHEFFISFQS